MSSRPHRAIAIEPEAGNQIYQDDQLGQYCPVRSDVGMMAIDKLKSADGAGGSPLALPDNALETQRG